MTQLFKYKNMMLSADKVREMRSRDSQEFTVESTPIVEEKTSIDDTQTVEVSEKKKTRSRKKKA